MGVFLEWNQVIIPKENKKSESRVWTRFFYT
ncbi:hypothetical protein SAMN05192546_10381 [Tindallia californiensis]|uniref:Uncharacterized protein n=1 Tax=Tindallia californiensis TaxID=159292 RepID=A0A1H3L5Q1_9FIRM|nr:hypothetical protein SAMN05192546_10381 [Tindallia californiensis]